jgi:hypothetical protein
MWPTSNAFAKIWFKRASPKCFSTKEADGESVDQLINAFVGDNNGFVDFLCEDSGPTREANSLNI